MAERWSYGVPVQRGAGGAGAMSDVPVAHGALRISGTVLDAGANWYVTSDRLGWSSVALVSEPQNIARGAACSPDDWDAAATLARCAHEAYDPVQTILALRDRLRYVSMDRCRAAGVAVARFGPDGRMVELVNASLPTVLFWDPVEGLSPYEPTFTDLDAVTSAATTEMLWLRPGSALVLATEGVLPHSAGWSALGSFVRALGLDAFGGTVADAPPSELARVLKSSWGVGDGPAGMVVAGLPSLEQQAA